MALRDVVEAWPPLAIVSEAPGPSVAFGVSLVTGIPRRIAAGNYLSHSRWRTFYGDIKDGQFHDNKIYSSSTDSDSWASWPSNSRVNILKYLRYPNKRRDPETHVFTGLIRLPKCKAGVYKFRLTSGDAAHLVIDGNVVLDNGGIHDENAVETAIALSAAQDHEFEVRTRCIFSPECSGRLCIARAGSLLMSQG